MTRVVSLKVLEYFASKENSTSFRKQKNKKPSFLLV